ncbi:MAG: zinc metallopeptidase [Eubacteriales bacterium]|nr:zinc metallopeptidase [Eubacteriales bacterium]
MYLSYLYLDWTMLLIIPGIIVAIWAQSKVRKAYNTYSKMSVMSGVSGSEVAGRILRSNGIRDVQVMATKGVLSDNYNPRKKTLNLSEANYSGRSIAAVAVAAHESGHALQHDEGYAALQIRSLIAPVVSAASYLLWPILILGILAGFAQQAIDIVVYIFLAIFVFQLITLPVEYNASRRALAALESENVLSDDEIYGAKKMLGAAALTYVAATLVALLNVIRFMALSRRR